VYTPLSAGVVDGFWVSSGSQWIDFLLDPYGQSSNPSSNFIGRSNYVGVAGAQLANGANTPFMAGYAGIMAQTGSTGVGTRLTDVIDGTSNTMMFGETLGGASQGQRDFALSWMGSGALATDWELQNPANWYNFSSRHPNMVQFCFGDGSVRPISTAGPSTNWFSARWYMFQAAAGMNDGQVINFNVLGE
jgi:prepilin-type processing-associated H-X9-DG protein